MRIISTTGDPGLARVYVAQFRGRRKFLAEFVEAFDPIIPRSDKLVIIVSTQFGCPVTCAMCDAGDQYMGDLSNNEIFAQIDHVLARHQGENLRSIGRLKVQFARMGEPALNPAVLSVLKELPLRYDFPGLIPCIATTAPQTGKAWLDALVGIRQRIYRDQPFQLQFSINSTDEKTRDYLMPIPKLNFSELAVIAKKFYEGGPRKVGLNFALAKGVPVNPETIGRLFDPACACIKITPLNPTARASKMALESAFEPRYPEAAEKLCSKFRSLGFDVILSIGDTRENTIGSNCGMAVKQFITHRKGPYYDTTKRSTRLI